MIFSEIIAFLNGISLELVTVEIMLLYISVKLAVA